MRRERASQPRSGEKRSKMGAVKVGAMVGDQACRFDSKAEYRYALWLEGEKKAGRVDAWVHHPGGVMLLGYRLGFHSGGTFEVGLIEPDFMVWRGAASKPEYHEVKGMASPLWRWKRRMFEGQCPLIPYVVIDAGWPDEKNGGPRLFDDRRKNKALRKKKRGAK